MLAAAAVVASYCVVAALAYALAALYAGLPLAGDAPLVFRGLAATYWDALWRVPPRFLGWVAALVAGSMLVVSAARAWRLREGGPAVAGMLGARYVDPWKCTPQERRLINVVEEMAIASGIAVPPVYVLRDSAVNALVAGYSPNEAAIIVTEGALNRLSRDELQAVMGHEYSHILNGDMALNVRIACVLAGLGWIGDFADSAWAAAREARRQGGDGNPALAAWLGLLALIGFPGVFAAGAIRAAICRQRELLADQASVQFTRNPDGIAGALDSILATHSHTVVSAAHAAELSHMFFAPAVSHWWTFPTHPPLRPRIARAHPRFDRAAYRERRHGIRREVAVIDGAGEVVKHVAHGPAVVAAPSAEHVDYAARLLASLPQDLREALHEAKGAEEAVLRLARGELPSVQRNHMLTLAELAIPAIKGQPQAARDDFLRRLAAAVRDDRRLTLAEFVLSGFLRQRLRAGAGQPIRTRFASIDELQAEAHCVLSLVAASSGDAAPAYARGNAILRLPQEAPLPAARLDAAAVDAALERLRQLAPLRKPAFLKACFEAARADEVFRLAEAELVRLIAATLDCPVPPLVAAQDPGRLPANLASPLAA